MSPEERCRHCGLDLGHRAWCPHAVGEPEPNDRDPDETDYDRADDRLSAQITGEPREVR